MRTKLISISIAVMLLVSMIALVTNYGIQAAGSAGDLHTWAQNHSYSTTCPEKDNVDVPLLSQHPIGQFRIVVTNPQYPLVPGDNYCPPNFNLMIPCSLATGPR